MTTTTRLRTGLRTERNDGFFQTRVRAPQTGGERERAAARRRRPWVRPFIGLGVVVSAPPRHRALERVVRHGHVDAAVPPRVRARPPRGHRATPRSFATLRIARAASNGDAADRAPPPPPPPSRHCRSATRSRSGSSSCRSTKWMHRTGHALAASSTRPRPSAHWSTTRAFPNRVSIWNVAGAIKAHWRHPTHCDSSTKAPLDFTPSSDASGSASPGPDQRDRGAGSRRVRSSSRASAEGRRGSRRAPAPVAVERGAAGGCESTAHASFTSEDAAEAPAPARSGCTRFLNGAPGGAELRLGRARVRVEDEVVIDEPEAVGDVGGGRSRGGRRVVRGGESRHRGAPAGANARAREKTRARGRARVRRERDARNAPSATERGGRAEGGESEAPRPDDEKARARDRKARQQPRPDDLFILLTTTTRIPRASAVPRAWA